MRKRLYLAALMFGLLGVTNAAADSLSANRALELVKQHKILRLEEILRLNRAGINGHVIAIELEGRAPRYYYELKVLRSDGRYAKLRIDARTGTILGGKKQRP